MIEAKDLARWRTPRGVTNSHGSGGDPWGSSALDCLAPAQAGSPDGGNFLRVAHAQSVGSADLAAATPVDEDYFLHDEGYKSAQAEAAVDQDLSGALISSYQARGLSDAESPGGPRDVSSQDVLGFAGSLVQTGAQLGMKILQGPAGQVSGTPAKAPVPAPSSGMPWWGWLLLAGGGLYVANKARKGRRRR